MLGVYQCLYICVRGKPSLRKTGPTKNLREARGVIGILDGLRIAIIGLIIALDLFRVSATAKTLEVEVKGCQQWKE